MLSFELKYLDEKNTKKNQIRIQLKNIGGRIKLKTHYIPQNIAENVQ